MPNDKDRDLLDRVSGIGDFFGSAILRDDLPDWHLAKELGDFLVRLWPEEVTGHLLLAKAYRHLGQPDNATRELQRCKGLIAGGKASPVDREALPPVVEAEERLLSSGGG